MYATQPASISEIGKKIKQRSQVAVYSSSAHVVAAPRAFLASAAFSCANAARRNSGSVIDTARGASGAAIRGRPRAERRLGARNAPL